MNQRGKEIERRLLPILEERPETVAIYRTTSPQSNTMGGFDQWASMGKIPRQFGLE
jgi:hypothetical protein